MACIRPPWSLPCPTMIALARILPLLLVAVFMTTGCGDQIGDSCSTNVDCSPLGDRICDTSQLEGYCTVEGCGLTTCPDEAVCIRFFPVSFLSQTCDPSTEDAVDPSLKKTNHCTVDETCLTSGFCAFRTYETRFCMKSCEKDSDCRSGYECRKTGTRGAEAVPDPEQAGVQQLRFCAQGL